MLHGTDETSSRSEVSSHTLLRPLTVALLAYRLGGAVNAADAPYQSERVPNRNSAADAANFYSEGGSRDVFNKYRVTSVWKMHGNRVTEPSGSHNIFHSDAT